MEHHNNHFTEREDESLPPYSPRFAFGSSTHTQFPNSYPSQGASTSSLNAHGTFSSPPDYDEATRSSSNSRQTTSQKPNNFQGSLSNLLNRTDSANGASHRPVEPLPLRTITSTAVEAGKIAMNMVEDILTETFDNQETRRRKKNMRRIQRKEDRRRLSEQLNQFTSTLSHYAGQYSFSPAQSSQQNRRLVETSQSSQQNQRLEIIQSSGLLTYEEDWSGDHCRLKTSMGPLTVRGVLTAREMISIENNTGVIGLQGSLFSKGDIRLRNINSSLSVLGRLQADRQLEIQLVNAPITIDTHIEGKEAKIRTLNAPIMLTQVVVQRELEVMTTNSPIVLHVLDITRRDADIVVESTNAPVTVYLPRTFSGRFYVSSSSTASVVAQTDDVRLAFEKEKNNKKYGRCMNMGNKSDVQVTIKTTNAPALLYI